MKTFDDLEFSSNPCSAIKEQATMFFPNGYGVSVITGGGAYGTAQFPYELAVVKGDAEDWHLCYETPITDDVCGFCTSDDITDLMERVQELPHA